MNMRDARKMLTLWLRSGHLTDLAVSCLIDDEIPEPISVGLRLHIRACPVCRGRMAAFMRVDYYSNNQDR